MTIHFLPKTDLYDAAVEEAIATCNGDLRGAESPAHVERTSGSGSDGVAGRDGNGQHHGQRA